MILPPYFRNKSRAAAQGQISIWCPALCLVGCDLSQTRGGEQLHIWLRPKYIRTLHKSEVKPEAWRQNFLLFACCDCETSTPALSIVLKDSESGWSDSQIKEPLLLCEGFSCYIWDTDSLYPPTIKSVLQYVWCLTYVRLTFLKWSFI